MKKVTYQFWWLAISVEREFRPGNETSDTWNSSEIGIGCVMRCNFFNARQSSIRGWNDVKQQLLHQRILLQQPMKIDMYCFFR